MVSPCETGERVIGFSSSQRARSRRGGFSPGTSGPASVCNRRLRTIRPRAAYDRRACISTARGHLMEVCPERYNVSTLIDRNLEQGRGGKVAIYHEDEQITYGDLLGRVCAMGRALRSLGVVREQRVLLLLDDSPSFPVAFFGAIRIGAVPVPVNPLF